jgi:DNA polymerase elongation subunit (family B)
MKALTPMTQAYQYERIVAIDIETSSDGALLDIGCYHGNYHHDEQYQTFSNWEQFFNYLLKMKGSVRIIAHNGFGFDFITFNQWFLENRKKYKISDDDITYLSSESLLIAMVIRVEDSAYTFLDTMRYFPATSLQKLAESFLGESKDDVPEDYISRMEIYKRKYRAQYYKYLQKDCELLYRIYVEFRKEINDFTEIGELGLSSGSTAMKSFRRWLGTDYPKTRIFSCPTEFQALADKSLRGGLTLYIGDGEHKDHQYENVNHYDVISMYPSVMRYVPIPSSPLVYTDKLIKDFDTYRPGWYLCNFTQQRGRVPILFTLESEYPQWHGQGILSHFEIQFLEQFGEYEVIDGLVYEDYLFPFEKYFDQLLALRMEAKRNKFGAKAHALKILANSLYGKFGQKAMREVIAITSNRDWYDSKIEARLRDFDDTGVTEYAVTDDYVIYGVESQSTSFSNRFIGAMVTALARLKLGCILNTYRAIYCDTDSIFTQNQLAPYFIGSQPGDFEESETSPNTMICLGKKSYQYGEGIKFKGVPSRNLSIDDIQEIRYGIDVDVEYKSPTAWRTAMKNNTVNPNEFLPRKRRVKRGESLAEMGLLHSLAKLFSEEETRDFLDSILSL